MLPRSKEVRKLPREAALLRQGDPHDVGGVGLVPARRRWYPERSKGAYGSQTTGKEDRSTKKAALIGLVQAGGLVIYCAAVAWLMMSGASWFTKAAPLVSMLFVLVLFVFSAVVSAAIVLGYPFRLFWRQRLGEAVKIVAATMGWLLLFMIGTIAVLALTG